MDPAIETATLTDEAKIERLLEALPNLTDEQVLKLLKLCDLTLEWNEKINLISRKDADNLFVHHLLHCLAIPKVVQFSPKANVLDLGTGGGFPGLPLAICFPETKFTLLDSTKKKLTAVEDMAQRLDLQNVKVVWQRVEEHKFSYDFVVGRAVTRLADFWALANKRIHTLSKSELPNGVVYLKGGDLSEELAETPTEHRLFKISDFFPEPYFESKMIVYLAKK